MPIRPAGRNVVTSPEGMIRCPNPCLGRQVATCTEANSTDRSHVGTDPVSVRYPRRYPRQFGLPTAKYISVYEFGSANRRDADRHGVCPYMRAERPSWHGVGRDNDKKPFHKVQNGRDDGNIGFVDMQNHPYINNTLSYAVDFSMTDGAGRLYAVDSSMTDSVGHFYAVDSSMTDGVGHFYAVDSSMTDGVGHFYAVDSSMTDGAGRFYAVDSSMTDGAGHFYAVDSIATMVLVVSTL